MIKQLQALLGLEFFTSPIDQFLKDFDQSHPQLSASQQREKEKFARIYRLRDDSQAHDDRDAFWDNF